MPTAAGEILRIPKAQEGRRNSPVDCFGVGNPRRGFPGAKHLKILPLVFHVFAEGVHIFDLQLGAVV